MSGLHRLGRALHLWKRRMVIDLIEPPVNIFMAFKEGLSKSPYVLLNGCICTATEIVDISFGADGNLDYAKIHLIHANGSEEDTWFTKKEILRFKRLNPLDVAMTML